MEVTFQYSPGTTLGVGVMGNGRGSHYPLAKSLRISERVGYFIL
jgi:hypothetical protein